MTLSKLTVIGFALAVAGCSPKPPPGVLGPEAKATIHEIMTVMITPLNAAALALPDEISDPISPEGKARAAQADTDWKMLRDAGLALAETSNLVVMEGREVAAPGVKLENEGQPTYLTAAQMKEKIGANHADFLKHAKVLQDASLAIVAAADAKNVDALFEAQDKVGAACSSCHAAFWYPTSAAAQ